MSAAATTSAPLDIDALRADTPGVANVLHFNNAGAALPPQPALEAQIAHLRLEAEIGAYEAAAREADRCDAVYDGVARLIGAAPDEIALLENATQAWQMAFYALPEALSFQPGDRILTAQAEYAANYVAYLQVARRTGARIELIPNDRNGAPDPQALAAMLDERVKLISITWVPTNGGLVAPAAEIGAIARAHGVVYLLDACQAVGQMPVDVAALGCDALSATARKFLRGPRGAGFLYVRRSLLERLEPPMIDHFAAEWVAPEAYRLRPDARRFENWENNYAARLGLGAAAEYALALGLERIQARAWALADRLRAGLDAMERARVRDVGAVRSAIVAFELAGVDAAAAKAALHAQGINLSVTKPSTTLLDANARELPPLLRASPHYYNTEDEIDRLLAALTDLA